jgi:hypothetical protein
MLFFAAQHFFIRLLKRRLLLFRQNKKATTEKTSLDGHFFSPSTCEHQQQQHIRADTRWHAVGFPPSSDRQTEQLARKKSPSRTKQKEAAELGKEWARLATGKVGCRRKKKERGPRGSACSCVIFMCSTRDWPSTLLLQQTVITV